MSTSPFKTRLYRKLRECGLRIQYADMRYVRDAFVEALKEEVESRWAIHDPESAFDMTIADTSHALYQTPLVIAGLGSFKMKTRPERKFDSFRSAQNPSLFGNDANETITKPPARRLAFTAKWEALP